MSIGKSGWGIGVAGCLAALWLSFGSRAAPMSQPASVPSPGPAESGVHPALMGTASCSARGCHGGMEPVSAGGQTALQNEYTTWIGWDKHARAFQVLFEERSRKIAAALKTTDKEGNLVPAHKDRRCLACHTNPATVAAGSEGSPLLEEEQSFGVGCEACHGSARGWYGPHTKPDWKRLTPKDKLAAGMTSLEDTLSLVRRCTGCHVGAGPEVEHGLPVRDVNHDLIAAGHPRLNFELAVFRANMPRHWSDIRERKRSEAKAWAVGQAASAQAALQLLQYRAATADKGQDKPWPEFAEYNCFACHHDLAQPSWRQQRGYPDRKPGALPWDTWYFSVLNQALGTQAPKKDPEILAVTAGLQKLREEMQKPRPDRGAVQQQAADVARQLERCAEQLDQGSYEQEALRRALLDLTRAGEKDAEDWDSATQYYLGIAAVNGSYHDLGIQPVLNRMAALLAFPPLATKPPSRYDSPKDFGPSPFEKDLSELFKKLGQHPMP